MLPERDLEAERVEQARRESWEEFHRRSGGGGRTRFEMYGAMPGFVFGIFTATKAGSIVVTVASALFFAAVGWGLFWLIKKISEVGVSAVLNVFGDVASGMRRRARDRAREQAWKQRAASGARAADPQDDWAKRLPK